MLVMPSDVLEQNYLKKRKESFALRCVFQGLGMNTVKAVVRILQF